MWKRPGLDARDRSIITVAALIARNQTIELPFYFNRALDSGVKPSEISEIVMHLAFYSGWPNAIAGGGSEGCIRRPEDQCRPTARRDGAATPA